MHKLDTSVSGLHSPNSKQEFSSHKKRAYGVSNTKKNSSKKKVNCSLGTDSSRKLNSVSKGNSQNILNINFINPKRGYTNAYKKKKVIQSETKRSNVITVNQFNDISEIQEFNITDEESLINSSILKNIDEHESIHEHGLKESTKKMKPTIFKKSMQSTCKKSSKKSSKKPKKMKFISSDKKSGKKADSK